MGYYTCFSGSIESGPATEKEVALAISNLDYFGFLIDDDDTINTIDDVIAYNGEMKWYSYQSDMERISKQFPDTVIKIHGEGEEIGDLWDAYFKNGKSIVYHAGIVYPPFNPADLEG